MLITVFTPTYNRAYTLTRLYESLCRQTFTDFEWIIVDDGSTDNTEEIVSGFMSNNNPFTIRYIKTENGGKHRAINKGVPLAKGKLFFILDSDDFMPQDALENIAYEYSIISWDIKDKVCALFGLRVYPDGKIIGKTFAGERLITSSIESVRQNIRGDKGEVFVTNILMNYPYPEIKGENFATESIVWDRMSQDGYKYIFFNKPICICQYLDDGLTNQGWELYARNPVQWSISMGQNYLFGKYSWYELSTQLYVYYMNVKDRISLKEMSKCSGLSKFHILSSVSMQYVFNYFRKIINKPLLKK